jgi:uncharacterized membrane protein
MARMKKILIVLNGFIHDFAAGYWLASIITIVLLHRSHLGNQALAGTLNPIERFFFWQSIAAMLLILSTGAGRTFTYVENWYGADAEKARRRMLMIKHLLLFAAFGAGYWLVWGMVFH